MPAPLEEKKYLVDLPAGVDPCLHPAVDLKPPVELRFATLNVNSLTRFGSAVEAVLRALRLDWSLAALAHAHGLHGMCIQEHHLKRTDDVKKAFGMSRRWRWHIVVAFATRSRDGREVVGGVRYAGVAVITPWKPLEVWVTLDDILRLGDVWDDVVDGEGRFAAVLTVHNVVLVSFYAPFVDFRERGGGGCKTNAAFGEEVRRWEGAIAVLVRRLKLLHEATNAPIIVGADWNHGSRIDILEEMLRDAGLFVPHMRGTLENREPFTLGIDFFAVSADRLHGCVTRERIDPERGGSDHLAVVVGVALPPDLPRLDPVEPPDDGWGDESGDESEGGENGGRPDKKRQRRITEYFKK